MKSFSSIHWLDHAVLPHSSQWNVHLLAPLHLISSLTLLPHPSLALTSTMSGSDYPKNPPAASPAPSSSILLTKAGVLLLNAHAVPLLRVGYRDTHTPYQSFSVAMKIQNLAGTPNASGDISIVYLHSLVIFPFPC